MEDVLTKIDGAFIDKQIEIQKSQELFDRMADLIVSIEPDSLSDEQLEEVINLLTDMEIEDEDEISEVIKGTVVRKYKLASKSGTQEKAYARKYYRKNRIKIKRKKMLFKRSAEGRKRKRLMSRMIRQHKTPTGRRKVRYRRVRNKAKEKK
jgi:hypothetical protein